MINRFLTRRLGDEVTISVQNPVRLSERLEPQPDVAVLKSREGYFRKLPGPEDVLLLIEVSDTSLSYDRNIPFDQARALLLQLGFEERTRGKHQHKFFRSDVDELLNLQETEGGKCKPYQVRQLREVFVKYKLREEL